MFTTMAQAAQTAPMGRLQASPVAQAQVRERAGLLGLLQELWQAPASAPLLRYVCLRGSQVHEGPLHAPWQEMLAAARCAQPQGVAQEYAQVLQALPATAMAGVCAALQGSLLQGSRAQWRALLASPGWPWRQALLQPLLNHPCALFYAALARLTLAVLEQEAEAAATA
ncbi:MAG: hypothetical protein ACT4NV_14960 [Rhodoferax sp.]